MKILAKFSDKLMTDKKYSLGFFLILLTMLSFFLSYMNTPALWGHDSKVHYARLDSLMTAIMDGNFPWYISEGIQGFGYFIKVFYCDLLLVPFAFVGIATNTIFAYELFCFTNTFLTGLLTYWAVNRIFKDRYAALLSALLFTFCSYRILDLYQRGALGEAVSFTFLPIVLVGAYELIKGDYKKWYILTIGFSLLIFNHVLSTVMTAIVLALFCILYCRDFIKQPKRIAYLILSAGATVIIVAYYLYPMLEQIASNQFYYDKYPSVSELHVFSVKISEVIGGLTNTIVPSDVDFRIRIGSLLTFGIICRIFVNRKTQYLRTLDLFAIIGIFILFATSQLFPWSVYPLNKLSFIQFPWRFTEFASFLFALSGGYYLSLAIQNSTKRMAMLGVLILGSCLVIVSEAKNFKEHVRRNDKPNLPMKEIPLDMRYSYGNNEYIPAKVTPHWKYLDNRGFRVVTQNKETRITDYKKIKGTRSFNVSIAKPDSLEIPMFYYKGYEATINNIPTKIIESPNGMVALYTKESGTVSIHYEGTIVQKISVWITIISSIGLVVYIYTRKRKNE